MTFKILAAVLGCLAVQAVLWLEGTILVEAVLGKVERPQVVLATMIVALGAIEALLLHLCGTVEQGVTGEKVKDHVHEVDRAIENLFSYDDDRRADAGVAFYAAPAQRFAIYREGFWRALKLFAIAAVLALVAVVLAAKVMFDIGVRLL